MNIELPREYKYKTKKTGEIVAYVEEGILKLKTITYFREIMRDISYKVKGTDICGYCGEHMEERTIDHMYPQEFGGPTITNNLLPTCYSCNYEKNNLTAEQYELYLLAKSKNKSQEYLCDLKNCLKYIRKWEKY